MNSRTALPLTQQLVGWVAQAMGVDDKLGVSKGTAKSARAGRVIARSWEELMVAALGDVGRHLPDEPRNEVLALLRRVDRRVSELQGYDLQMELKLPLLLRLVVPGLACRVAALVAFIEAVPPLAGEKPLPAIATCWLDPLNPRLFGQVVTALLKHSRPELRTWDERYAAMEVEGIAARKTFHRWRSSKVVLPNVAQMEDVSNIVHGDQGKAEVLLALRLTRLLTAIRELLENTLGDDGADQTATLFRRWAAAAKDALDGAVIDTVGSSADSNPRQSPDMLLAIVAAPSEALLLKAAATAQPSWQPLPAEVDPFETLSAHWGLLGLFREIVVGGTTTFHDASGCERTLSSPSRALTQLADEALSRSRVIWAEGQRPLADELDDDGKVLAQFMVELGYSRTEVDNGFEEILQECVAQQQRRNEQAGAVHPSQLPVLASFAVRAGHAKFAVRFLREWLQSDHLTSTDEHTTAAESFVLIQTQAADSAVALMRGAASAGQTLPSADLQAVPKLVTSLDATFAIVERLLGYALCTATPATRAMVNFPLACRLDWLEAALSDAPEGSRWPRVNKLSADVDVSIKLNPSDPRAWSVSWAIHHICGRRADSRHSRKQAVHHGGEQYLDELGAALTAIGEF